jgi:TP901 family phage tail tape measure protein
MPDQIKIYGDFFEQNANDLLKLLKDSLQSIYDLKNKLASEKPITIIQDGSGKEAIDLTNEINKLKAAKQQLSEAEKLELSIKNAQLAAEKDLQKARDNAEKSLRKEIGDINSLEAANRLLVKQRKSLVDINGENITKYNQLTKEIAANQTQINKHNEEIKRYQGNVGNYLGKLSEWGANVGKQFLAVTAGMFGLQAVLGILKEKMTVIFEFEKSMSNLRAMTGLTKEEVKVLGGAAIEMSKKYGVAAKDIVEGMKLIGGNKPELLKSRDGMIEVTNAALILAKASGLELPDAAKRLTDAMNQFSLPAKEAAKTIDQLAQGALLGAAEIPDITDALLKFGAVAKSSNIDLGTSVSLIETLAARGLKGEEAGTPLRNIILQMDGVSVASKKALAELKEWGVNTEIVSNRTLPFSDRLKELSKIQYDAGAMMKFFQKENVIAGTILLEDTTILDGFNKKINEHGVALKLANVNTDNTIDKWAKVKTNVDAAILSFVNNSSAVKSLTDDLVSLTDKVGDGQGKGTSFAMSILDKTLQGMYNNFFGYGIKAINAFGTALDWLGTKLKTSQQATMDFLGLKETPMDTILKKLGIIDDKKVSKEVGVEWFWQNPDVLPDAPKKKSTSQISQPLSPEEIAAQVKAAKELQKKFDEMNKQTNKEILLAAKDKEKAEQEEQKRRIAMHKQTSKEIVEANKAINKQYEDAAEDTKEREQLMAEFLIQKEYDKLDAKKQSLENMKGLFKENTIAFKAITMAQTSMAMYEGITKATAKVEIFPLNFVLAATILADGLYNLSQIAGIKFAEGVVDFKGRGNETDDQNPVLISNRESIITAKGTKNAPGLLKGINEGYIKDSDFIINNSNTNSTIFKTEELERKLERQIEETKKMSQKINKSSYSYLKDGKIHIVKGDGTIEIMLSK